MEAQNRIRRYKTGLWLCWIAVLSIPAGGCLIDLGMCSSGSTTVIGNIALVIFGLFSTIGAFFGIGFVIQGMRAIPRTSQWGGIIGMVGACLAILPGAIYVIAGYFSGLELLRLVP